MSSSWRTCTCASATKPDSASCWLRASVVCASCTRRACRADSSSAWRSCCAVVRSLSSSTCSRWRVCSSRSVRSVDRVCSRVAICWAARSVVSDTLPPSMLCRSVCSTSKTCPAFTLWPSRTGRSMTTPACGALMLRLPWLGTTTPLKRALRFTSPQVAKATSIRASANATLVTAA